MGALLILNNCTFELLEFKVATMDAVGKIYQQANDIQAVAASLVERSCPSAMSEVRI